MVDVAVKDWFEVIENMENKDYRDYPAISKSDLDRIHKSIAHWQAPSQPPTADMIEGSAAHCIVLETDKFHKDYVRSPKFNRRTKEGKLEAEAFELRNKGRTPLNEDQYYRLESIYNAVYSHPTASKLFENGRAEVSYFWEQDVYVEGQFHKVTCKARTDFVTAENNVLVDLKTTRDASPESFAKSVAQYRYHVQAAWYREGWYRIHGEYPAFVFVCVEKTPPYEVAIYTLDEGSLAEGWLQAKSDLAKYAFWKATPELERVDGYPIEITELSLPRWAFKEN
tara:strand:- start:2191 stop:3036 length:846 start_codon:yes stop_codon:yes gene_type:complete